MSEAVFISRKQELPLKGENTSLFLQIIISIAVFIYAITLSGVLSVDSMIQNWNRSILGSLTVQIIPVTDTNQEKARAETLAYEEKAVDFLGFAEVFFLKIFVFFVFVKIFVHYLPSFC